VNIIERKWTVNEISLEKYFTYCKQVYQIGGQLNDLERMKLNCKSEPKTKARTVGKMIFTAASLIS